MGIILGIIVGVWDLIFLAGAFAALMSASNNYTSLWWIVPFLLLAFPIGWVLLAMLGMACFTFWILDK